MEDLNERLFQAAVIGKSGYVKRLLEKGAQLSSTVDQDGYNALHVAVREGHVRVVQVFIDMHVDLDVKTEDGYTPLLLAALNGYADIVSALIKAGVDIHAANMDGYNSLHISAQYGYVKVVRTLIKNNARLNEVTNDGFSALLLSCEMGFMDIVQKLVKAKADLNLGDSTGQTPLHCAASLGFVEILRLLVKHGAELDRPNNEGFTAIHMASSLGFADVVDALVQAGANVNSQSQTLYTPLLEATMNRHAQIAQKLIVAGADVQLANLDGDYPALLAAELGLVTVLEDIVAHAKTPYSLEVQNDYGLTPLLAAAMHGHLPVVLFFLKQHPVDLTVCDRDGRSALHLAVVSGHEAIVEVLLESLTLKKVNQQDKYGATPLFLAAELGQLSMVQKLVQACCSPLTSNLEGTTPAMIAAIKGHKTVLHYLTDMQQHVHTDHLCQLQSTLETSTYVSTSDDTHQPNTTINNDVQTAVLDQESAAAAATTTATVFADQTINIKKMDPQLLRSLDSEDILSETRLAGSSDFDADIHATSYEWEVVTCPHTVNTVHSLLHNAAMQPPYTTTHSKKTFVRTSSPAISHPVQQPSFSNHQHQQQHQQQQHPQQVPVLMKVHRQQPHHDATELLSETVHQRELEALKTGYMERVFTLERQVKALQMILLDEHDVAPAVAPAGDQDEHMRRSISVDSDLSSMADTQEGDQDPIRWMPRPMANVTQQIERVCGEMTQQLVRDYKLRDAVVLTVMDRAILTSLCGILLLTSILLLLFIRYRLA